VRAVLFDMDGVIYVGKQPLPGVCELLAHLEATGRQWMFVTNNAGMTSAQFTAKLVAMGFDVPPERILGSSEATAQWLRTQIVHHGWPDGRVIVLGMEGLRAALRGQGFELTTDPAAAAYAVAGIHTELTYRELSDVTLAIRAGARFIGTNGDRTLPSERGQVPGAGSILALLETATDVKPIVIGKPNAPMFEIALERLGVTPSQTLMVGDRYETDIAGAQTLGMTTAAVLTGVHARDLFERQAWPPDFILAGLPELLARFQE
jgi:4-nitrophenyl phosphatase